MPVACAAGAGGSRHLQAREILLPGAGLLQLVGGLAELDQAPCADPPPGLCLFPATGDALRL